jgi:hypothetical protein
MKTDVARILKKEIRPRYLKVREEENPKLATKLRFVRLQHRCHS